MNSERYSSNQFSLEEVIGEFNHPPYISRGNNVVNIDTITINGRLVKSEQKEYSIFSRLTQGKIPYVKVQLPGKVLPFTLAKIVPYHQEEYRLDLFGGSAMKGNYKDKTTGSLIGLNIKDTRSDSDFTKQIQNNFFTSKESFYYFQRAMLPTISQKNVLEGKFKIGIFPDTDEILPKFIIRNSNNEIINIKIHDGCGFIKESLYKKLSGITDKLFGENEGRLSYQALQHYKANESVIRELTENAGKLLEKECRYNLQDADKDLIFNSLSNGNVQGELGIAIASLDDKVYLPTSKVSPNVRKIEDRFSNSNMGVLIGRSPYISKASLVAVSAKQISHGEDSATSRYISELSAIQYSFTGKLFYKNSSNNEIDKNDVKQQECYSFFKGISVVISDKDWPKEYEDLDIVFSSEDQKLSPTWKENKNKVSKISTGTFYGILAAADYYSKGSFVALPTKLQKGLGGDYDGDHNLIISEKKYPFLYKVIFDNQNKKKSNNKENLIIKPVKTFTSAIIEEKYNHSRVAQIMGTTFGIIEDYTILMAVYKLQSKEKRKELNDKCINIIEEYFSNGSELEQKFYQSLKIELELEDNLLLKHILSKGIYEGTDAYKRTGFMKEYKLMGRLLKDGFAESNVSIAIPYGNSLKRKLDDRNRENVKEVISSIKKTLEPYYEVESGDNISLAIMKSLINRINVGTQL